LSVVKDKDEGQLTTDTYDQRTTDHGPRTTDVFYLEFGAWNLEFPSEAGIGSWVFFQAPFIRAKNSSRRRPD
jgi:hypothetical protein